MSSWNTLNRVERVFDIGMLCSGEELGGQEERRSIEPCLWRDDQRSVTMKAKAVEDEVYEQNTQII
jgi:hypothetical protein